MFSSVARKYARSVTNIPVHRVAFRAFATDQAHRPVISVHGLAVRYANATYVAASKANILEQGRR